MRTNYKVCEMEGMWHVVKDNKILSYEQFMSREDAEWYANAMNGQLTKIRECEDEIFKHLAQGG